MTVPVLNAAHTVHMASTSSRTLRLLSLLQTHRQWAGEDLAARLSVSVRTLRRDVDRLRDLSYPVRASRGVDGGYQLAPGATLPPLVLDDDEAVALAVGLQNTAQDGSTALAEAAVRVLTKVVQVMPAPLRRRMEMLRAATSAPVWRSGAPAVDPDALVAVAQTCRDAERLTFDYTAAGGARTHREVEPLRLVPIDRRWYLVAFDLDRHDWRSFRLDRLSGPAGTGNRFRARTLPAGDAAAYVRAGLEGGGALRQVAEAVVRADAATVRQHIGQWANADDRGDGSCLVRMETDSLDWPAMALGSLGVEFSVLAPPALADLLRDWSARFSRAAG